ncbi:MULTISPECIES: hypothetical protein [unclassified Methylobacterium]|jgi:hypothetical protein|uniref:hypothetical protein n=1 Tax=Methylobacterium TaxID=407 RepID=UPI001FBACACC|nr:hypothetical protein [Methylobacterium sp. J-067]MCJ2027266.1 hypothetical protein [Methylobacterium sp. J-067]
MERLLIFLAVLVLILVGAIVAALAARSRRPPLHMDSEFHHDDTDLLIGPVGRRRESPIDRSADIIDVSPQAEPADARPHGGER